MGKDAGQEERLTTLYLVRHAKAGERRRWNGDDRLRPLSKQGWKQAVGLVEMVGGHSIDRLITSSYVRCRQTLEPLAAERGLTIEEDPALEEGANLEDTLDLVEGLSGTVVLCSHGDVIPELMKHFRSLGLNVRGRMQSPKGSTWVIETAKTRPIRASYVPPMP